MNKSQQASKNGCERAHIPDDPGLILEAVKKAYRYAVWKHRALGIPMVFWEDGKVVITPPEELPNITKESIEEEKAQ